MRTHRKPAVRGQVAVAVPATSDEFAGAPGLQWQWQANPQPQWLGPTPPAAGQLRLAAVPAGAQNLYLVPNLLLQKLPAEQFTATTKLAFYPKNDGEQAGLVVLGVDYASLTLGRRGGQLLLTQNTCLQADKGRPETSSPPVALPPGQPLYLRVAVRAGARCQFSYSRDGQQFTPLGPEFTAREGRWVGAKMGLFCLGAAGPAPAGYAEADWWRVTP